MTQRDVTFDDATYRDATYRDAPDFDRRTATTHVAPHGRIAWDAHAIVTEYKGDLSLGDDALAGPMLEIELGHAVENHELRIEFQPIVRIDSSVIVGYEALVRWQHGRRGLLAPSEFLGIAQASTIGAAIDDWVLAESCRQAACWTGPSRACTICVNSAPERFVAPGFSDRVGDILHATGLDPSRLLIEITEWSVLHDLDGARATIAALAGFGVRVALDDYGTGYASLASVAMMPVDELKIDISFVAGLGSDRARTAIVRAIIGLGNALDITVVAEGVENADQAFALHALGCEYGQGFHFGRPTPFPAPVSNAVAGIS